MSKIKNLIKSRAPAALLESYSIARVEWKKKFNNLEPNNVYHPLHDSRKAVFIHIPKAAGNTVTQHVYGVPSLTLGAHIQALKYRSYSLSKFYRYYFFSFVRNPYDRLYSAFSYLKSGGMTRADLEFSKQYVQKKDNFEDFVLSLSDETYLGAIQSYVHFSEQWRFVCNEYHKIIINDIYKYENFPNSMKVICKKFNIKYVDIRENVTSGRSLSFAEVYTPEMYDIVYHLYRPDFEIFGYPRTTDI